jgi:hypothetical protein
MGEPYNKSYYPQFFLDQGFVPVNSWTSVFSVGSDRRRIIEKLKKRYDRAIDRGYTFRHIELSHWEEEIALVYDLITDSFSAFMGFHPLKKEVFIRHFSYLRNVIDPDLVYIALDPEDAPVGFGIVLPDLSPALRAMNGEDSLFAKIGFLLKRKKRDHHIGIYIGAKKEAVSRFPGIGGALGYLEVLDAERAGKPFIMALMSKQAYTQALAFHDESAVHTYELYEKSL